MRKLIIDALDLPQIFGRTESVLDFHPHALKGLVVDCLLHYLSGPAVFFNTDQRDQAFMDQILQKYFDSDQYRVTALSPDDPATEQIVWTICYAALSKTREMIEHHEMELRKCNISYDTVTMHADHFEILYLPTSVRFNYKTPEYT